MNNTSSKTIDIRFSEVDAMGIVWHGNYVKYFEDGREQFGRDHDFSYLYIANTGFMLPLVEVKVNYKRSLLYRDRAIVETHFVDTPAAKVIFDYTIRKEDTGAIVCTGRTVQVFIDQQHRLQLEAPEFFQVWKAGFLNQYAHDTF